MKLKVTVTFILLFVFYLLSASVLKGVVLDHDSGEPIPGVNVIIIELQIGASTNAKGEYIIKKIPKGNYTITTNFITYSSQSKSITIKDDEIYTLNFTLIPQSIGLKEDHVTVVCKSLVGGGASTEINVIHNTESYDRIYDNPYKKVKDYPLSTFSIDVDAASYSNMRRFLNNNQMPVKDAIRIEEMINYFNYDYPYPENKHPFSIYTEISECPWNNKHILAHIGIQGKKIENNNKPSSNLVFLIDVSGSMGSPAKLPLLKKAFKLLIDQLGPDDIITIVVYASAEGLVLEPTSCNNKEKIINAIENLNAGGSTAGGAGIILAYKKAKESFINNGNNRIILATDGDFNVGASSDAEMIRLIEEKRNDGIFLTVLGFGMGNYKDSKMEKLADKGNGNYAYIDNILEAKKVFVNEIGSTLFTIAKDVKIQVEFNPANVYAYRLIGYENRMLETEDFHNDSIDAGELGSEHSVTALYEIIPLGVEVDIPKIDTLRYQKILSTDKQNNDEIMLIKFRYKNIDNDKSNLILYPVKNKILELNKTSDNFRFAAAVAGFGMILRDSKYKGNFTYSMVDELAKDSKGDDRFGYRSEFIRLIEQAKLLDIDKNQ